MGYLGIIVTGRCEAIFLDLKIMIRGLLWELQLCSDFCSVKKYVWVAFRVWKLASPWVFVSEDPISFIYRCEKAEKLFAACRHSFRRFVFSFIFIWRKKAFHK